MPPPKVELNLSPVKDAFVRSNVPRLNYGEEQEMMVGRTMNGEDFNSLIQFDIRSIPAGVRLKKARLMLYVEQTAMVGTPIGLYEIEADWSEVGVTWASTPVYGRRLTELNADVAKEHAEVDVLDIVKEWYNGTAINMGILLKAEQQLMDVYARFGTRERGDKYEPKLVIEYDDPKVASPGFAEVIAHIVARQNKDKEVKSTITIKSTWDDSPPITGHIRVLNPMMIETFLTVRRDNMYSKITVKRKDDKPLTTTITVRSKDESVLLTNLVVTRDFLTGFVTVRRADEDEIPSVITVRRLDDDDSVSSITVSRPSLAGLVSVIASSVIPSTITVIGEQVSDVESLLTVRRSDERDITSSIEVWSNSSLESSIMVKSGYLASSITVPFKGNKDLKATIRVNERYHSDLTTTLEIIQGSSLPCSITVEMYDDGSYVFIM
ncbi:DNRLRE domain-containing protein [Paenibacillus sp. NPDC057967]|uniref:DNRLRE domain-containing protein n=1 Tax=Paenibacillus sp. NPDC057967 TaxID=3346293 RepID=UPI0036DD9D28